ncbi:OST-HTH/LOTUS domain-containing protein [Phycicoccus sp. MQZ13P-5]|uniref:OST-HTH/LOTUS domain-containing protein n=2 Tax=Phycicoccus sonneratiae TaxID=2807628 RepID=A0ABS2CT15_9MICO|nr:OST-HTH/LOTUS domain-containing protein [Phycicoccus sonneraticus]
MHLREHGVAVYGFGDAKTPAPFQSACTRFLVLDRLPSPSGEASTDDDSPEPPRRATRKATAKATTAAETPARATTRKTARKTSDKSADKSADKAGGRSGESSADKSADAAPPAASTPERATRAQLRQDARLVSLLRGAVDSASDETGWAKIGTVGQRIARQSSFDSRNYGYAKLSRLIEASDLFEVRDAGTPDMAMRDPRAT